MEENQDEQKKIFADKKERLSKLTGFLGILPGKFIFVVPEIYKTIYPDDQSKWPVFKIKPIDGIEFNQGLDNGDMMEVDWEKKKIQINRGKYKIQTLKNCLKGWKNFKQDPESESEIAFIGDEHGAIDEDIRVLPPSLQDELLKACDGVNKLTMEEEEGLKF